MAWTRTLRIIGVGALGYLIGAFYWYYIGSLNVQMFVGIGSVLVLAVIAGIAFIYLRNRLLGVIAIGALAAMFTATYWIIELIARL